MAFIDSTVIEQLKTKFTSEPSSLGKLYKSKRNNYYIRNVDHNLAEAMIKEGWEEIGQLKTKTRLRKLKSHSTKFEDDIWCQLYDLGYRCLNISNDFSLNFGKDFLEKKQIDVFAVNEDSILLIECKSSRDSSKASSLKTEFEGLDNRLQGFSKTLEQLFGERTRKIKYIFATRNLRIDEDSADIQRLESTGSFFYNDNTFEYVNSLIKAYKKAAHYQFMSLLFKGKSINKDRIEVPAIEGFMGKKKYYMFSIEPHLLLKIGFILHRTRANKSEMPTYQRLLVPQRLKGISKFIEEGGYFPNSIILNFSKNEQLQFEAAQRVEDSHSRLGILKIPNAYAIAYIIDGQHRVYGYAQSEFKESNTIPVVAFYGLESAEQLKIFMDINENQKAVSPTLRMTLEKDLYWDAERADSRIKALRSAITEELSTSSGPLYNKISLGEDKAKLSANPFGNALVSSGLLPKANGNKYEPNSAEFSLYNIHNLNHDTEMRRTLNSIVKFLNKCYGFVEENYPIIYNHENYFIVSNRGTFAFISTIGSLNIFESNKNHVNVMTSPEDRFQIIRKYLDVLMTKIENISKEEVEKLFGKLGQGAEVYWFRFFQTLIYQQYPEFLPDGLTDWMERQDQALLESGRKYGTEVEKYIKKNVIENLKILFKKDWDLEIGSIKNECVNRANSEMHNRHKDGFDRKEIPWTDMFFILDYKTIIEKYWTKLPEDAVDNFRNFEEIFSIDVGHGFNSKSDKTKWLSLLNTYRNSYAHDGTKEKGLTKEEVKTLEKIHEVLIEKQIT